ncbi:signal peptidase II [Methylibium petroleiphilum]|uniref:signal peptidase II n=2 Tax=Methylibium petroleiphilum TaxID=105560 RepID=UPI003D2AF211
MKITGSGRIEAFEPPMSEAARRAARTASRGRRWLLMGVAALLLVLDQSVKWVVAANLPLGGGITVTAWLNLVHVLNPGASFSFLADAGGWQRHALTAVGVAVSVALSVLLWRGVRSRLETAAYVGLIGGALGNVVDRLGIGAVVDYLDLHWRGMHWPAFNLADIFIVGSAALLVLASFGLRADSSGADRGSAT